MGQPGFSSRAVCSARTLCRLVPFLVLDVLVQWRGEKETPVGEVEEGCLPLGGRLG